ncbi:hypothetical protein V7S43_015833 [Phytophthora oleae]|uniref:Protein kinase domain-containing protein n=1 Tax=Phytophthora oleae TaxID=2107226 RepID=A0ABD3EZF8_9STRA
MMLEKVLLDEKEFELIPNSVAVPVEELAGYAAQEILQGDIKQAVKNYQPTAISRLCGKKCMPEDLTPQKLSLKWVLRHEEVIQKRDGDIASGAFARVYRGLWLGASVALKKIVKVGLAEEQALHEEVNIWYKLRHPNIVSLYGACCEKHQMFVCELIDEMPLSSCVRKKVTELEIWQYLHDAAVGLQGLHWHKIVHADLKGNNILVTTDGRAKLIDFGLSCLQSVDGGAAMGALRWKAPECLNGQGPIFESDVFSLGMCIIEALAGKLPWGNKHDSVVKADVKKGLLPSKPESFSPVQWELVLRMCCFKPQDRLRLDDVIKVLGVFAGRSPYINNDWLKYTIAQWQSED